LPVILVALAVAAFIGSSMQNVIAVLGLLLWERFSVVTRSATMQVRALD
jgi:peptide/nickel transport system permease protein